MAMREVQYAYDNHYKPNYHQPATTWTSNLAPLTSKVRSMQALSIQPAPIQVSNPVPNSLTSKIRDHRKCIPKFVSATTSPVPLVSAAQASPILASSISASPISVSLIPASLIPAPLAEVHLAPAPSVPAFLTLTALSKKQFPAPASLPTSIL